MKIDFYDVDSANTPKLKFVVLQARYKDNWVFVRHKERSTWEIPGGHIEEGETPDEAASRELIEETGATDFSVEALFDYSVTLKGVTNIGRLYYCVIKDIGNLGDYEIDEIMFDTKLPSNLTYDTIQPYLFEQVKKVKKL